MTLEELKKQVVYLENQLAMKDLHFSINVYSLINVVIPSIARNANPAPR